MYSFFDIYQKCVEFNNGKISKRDLDSAFEKLEVIKYIPISELFVVAYIIQFNEIARDMSEAEVSTYSLNIEIVSQLHYLGLKCGINFDSDVMTYDFFDTVNQSGLMEYVVNNNRFQYDRYLDIIRRAIDVSAVGVVGEIAKKLNLHTDDLLNIAKEKDINDMMEKVGNLLTQK